MNLFFHTSFTNVWVPYYKKYFTSKPDINFTIETNNKGMSIDKVKEADVLVMCWANEAAIHMTNNLPKLAKKYIVIVRSYEIFYGFLNKINWKNVDAAIFVNQGFYSEYKDKLGCKCYYMPNAIDCEEWKMQDHKESYNLGWVANLNHKKGLNIIPHIMNELCSLNKNYKLHLVGKIQEPRFIIYCNHLFKEMGIEENIIFDGYCENIKEWWKDKDYCLTCSVTEGHPNNVLEAMALGVKPIIHNWIGAKESFPNNLIWTNLKECIDLIHYREYDGLEYRRFVEDNYDIWKVYPMFEEIIRN